MTGANGEVSFINIKTLNEWDSRVRRPLCHPHTTMSVPCRGCCHRPVGFSPPGSSWGQGPDGVGDTSACSAHLHPLLPPGRPLPSAPCTSGSALVIGAGSFRRPSGSPVASLLQPLIPSSRSFSVNSKVLRPGSELTHRHTLKETCSPLVPHGLSLLLSTTKDTDSAGGHWGHLFCTSGPSPAENHEGRLAVALAVGQWPSPFCLLTQFIGSLTSLGSGPCSHLFYLSPSRPLSEPAVPAVPASV